MFKKDDKVICIEGASNSLFGPIVGQTYTISFFLNEWYDCGVVGLLELSDWWRANRFKLCEETKEETKKDCSCDITQLMREGCICGSITRYGVL